MTVTLVTLSGILLAAVPAQDRQSAGQLAAIKLKVPN